MKRKWLILSVIFSMSAFAAPAMAIPLLPGDTLFIPGHGVGLGPPNYSTALPAFFIPGNVVGTLVAPIGGGTGEFSGTVTSTVYKNPADLNHLGFQYVFNATQTDTDLIRGTIGDPTNPWLGIGILDAGADDSGSSSTHGTPFWTDGDPKFILRDPTVAGEGLTIQWRSESIGTTLIAPTGLSARIFFVTNAFNFKTTNVGVIDTGAVGMSKALAPAVPEPASLLLLGSGLIGMVLFRRRLRK